MTVFGCTCELTIQLKPKQSGQYDLL